MTRDEILAMKPGRELDALVAERVLRLKRGVDFGERVPLATYSADIAAAMDIIFVMAKRGWDFALYYEAASERWTAYFLRDYKDPDARAQSDLLAEATCKAALLGLVEEGDAT